MKKTFFILPFLVVLFLAFPSSGPRAAEEFPFISTEELSKGIQSKTLFVVDCNNPDLYQQKHIPTAIHMNSSEPEGKVLPKDKNATLVFYCKNPRCMASHDGARFAKSQGYSNVRVYPLGIDGWEKAGMPLESPKQ
jgi:rhodanese-related sulfurtransferase